MSPYRTPSPPEKPRRRRLGAAICWLRTLAGLGLVDGHAWKATRTNERRAWLLGHLHPMAGSDAVCIRCGAEWFDAGGSTAAAIGWAGPRPIVPSERRKPDGSRSRISEKT